MPKRKSPYSHSERYSKRSHKSSGIPAPDGTSDANLIPIGAAPPPPTLHDPSTHTPAFVAAQKAVVVQKLHHARKIVVRALKGVKGLERVRMGKKVKVKGGSGSEAQKKVKLEKEIEMLRSVDLVKVAEGVLGKLLGRQKRIVGNVFWPGDVVEVEWVWRRRSGEEGTAAGVEKDREEEVVRNNVVALLCNHKPVKDALAQSLEMVKEVMGVVDEKKKKVVEKTKKKVVVISPESESGSGGESDDDDDEEDEEEEDTISSKSKSTSTTKITNPSILDPSRGADEEWSGDEEEADIFDEDDDDDAASGSEDDDDDDDEDADSDAEKDVDTTALFSKLDKFIAPASDSDSGSNSDSDGESSSSSSPSPDLSNSSSPPPPQTKAPKILKSTKLAPKSKSKSTTDDEKPRIEKSTFLPSLMSGYISGSDNDSDAPDAAYYSRLKGGKKGAPHPPEKAERKNRMGQQARRALAEKKFGEKARHVRLGLGGAGQKRDAKEKIKKHAAFALERAVASGKGTGRGQQPPAREKMKSGLPVVEGPLHPSWEAARKVKEAKAQAKFVGKKIKFD
ncbi:Bud-site selection protein [Peziza echinospora]|nr:Bud-site selection protein [Peziza echinospora]